MRKKKDLFFLPTFLRMDPATCTMGVVRTVRESVASEGCTHAVTAAKGT